MGGAMAHAKVARTRFERESNSECDQYGAEPSVRRRRTRLHQRRMGQCRLHMRLETEPTSTCPRGTRGSRERECSSVLKTSRCCSKSTDGAVRRFCILPRTSPG